MVEISLRINGPAQLLVVQPQVSPAGRAARVFDLANKVTHA
jgi:hypothetical protein